MPRQRPTSEAGGIRERILAAATDILGETGIQGLSQVQVARRADVRQSHLTYYFPTRHDLLEAVALGFVEGLTRGVARAAAASAADDDPDAVLQRIAAAIADEAHMRMFTGVIVEADGDPALRAIVVRVMRRLQATLAELLGGDDATQRAGLALASMWGVGLYNFLLRPKRGAGLTLPPMASAPVTTRARASRKRAT
jgi:AcrR family transcriptional regulator